MALDVAQLERRLATRDPSFATALRTYVGEASFFHDLVSADLADHPAATIVEVGAGIGLLALHLAADGHEVTAFEPQSAGYGRNRDMRTLVLECWDGAPPAVRWCDTAFDPTLLGPRPVDLALSLNVLEHVEAPAELVADVVAALPPGGRYRAVCPNYLIPYEPHFHIPTLFSKRLTERVFAERIRTADKDDPIGLWDELSWPTHHGLQRDLAAAGVDATFSRRASRAYLRRVRDDPSFETRKGPVVGALVRRGGQLLDRVVARLPMTLLPVIDVTARPTP